jgi:hypothetical protein
LYLRANASSAEDVKQHALLTLTRSPTKFDRLLSQTLHSRIYDKSNDIHQQLGKRKPK